MTASVVGKIPSKLDRENIMQAEVTLMEAVKIDGAHQSHYTGNTVHREPTPFFNLNSTYSTTHDPVHASQVSDFFMMA